MTTLHRYSRIALALCTAILSAVAMPHAVALVPAPTAATVTAAAAAGQDRPTVPSVDAARVAAVVEHTLQERSGALGEGFAGAWLDRATGRVVIGFAGDGATSARADQQLGRLFDDPNVTVVTREFALGELDAVLERVARRLNHLLGQPPRGAPWPFMASVDVEDNVVDVVVDPRVSDRRASVDRLLATELRTGRVRVSSGPVDQHPEACSRSSCFPIRGGTSLTSSSSSCTSGFVLRTSLGFRRMSTAAHCTGSPWYHAGTAVGPSVWSRNSGSVDARAVAPNNPNLAVPSNTIYRPGDQSTSITQKITSPGSSLHGNYLCKEGAVGGSQCGALRSYNATFNGRPGFGMAEYAACPGDSGAAVVNSSTNRAYGIHTGGAEGCPGPSYFSWTASLEAASDYTVLLQPTTESLAPGQSLFPNQYLASPDGRIVVRMQTDGNLVVRQPVNVPIWASNTQGNSGTVATMQTDGNMVLYAPGHRALCSTRTQGNPGAYLKIQNDGNLVVYSASGTPLWASQSKPCYR